MSKEKIFTVIKIINTIPLAGVGLILFLGSGFTLLGLFVSGIFRIIVIGYIIALVFGLLSYKKSYFLWLSLIGWFIFGLGYMADIKEVSEENQKFCLELRAEPSCVEDECGFNCSNFYGDNIGLVTGGSVCKDKDMNLCKEKIKREMKVEKETQDVLKVYSNIVDKIITSPSPANENFENQLVAIYNCLEKKFGPGAKGEVKAVQVLRQKNLTSEQLNKYYSYQSSKGRNITPNIIVAGLPGGDKNLSCEYINVK